MEGSFLGLGYHSAAASHQQQQHHEAQAAAVPSAPDNADVLMKQYLQQCLEYHEEQQALREEETTEQMHFVPSSHPANQQSQSTEEQCQSSAEIIKDSPKETSKSTVVGHQDINSKVEEARSRARAILQRFQQQQQELLLNPSTASVDRTTVSLYREQRVRAFQREEERKRRALLKNLDYLARKQTQRLEQLSAQTEQTELHYKTTLEERKRANLQSQAGIGSKKRQHIELRKQATGSIPRPEDASVAVYLSGLPIDGSIGEDFLRQLFGSYGKIRKIHFYRSKETNELKGDGLVIFELLRKSEMDELLENVCSQVSRELTTWSDWGIVMIENAGFGA